MEEMCSKGGRERGVGRTREIKKRNREAIVRDWLFGLNRAENY